MTDSRQVLRQKAFDAAFLQVSQKFPDRPRAWRREFARVEANRALKKAKTRAQQGLPLVTPPTGLVMPSKAQISQIVASKMRAVAEKPKT